MLWTVAVAAIAADTWTTPHPGVRLLHRTTTSPSQSVWAAEVDLCARGVSVRATTSDERQRTVSAFGTLVNAEVAVNGDFFSFTDYDTSGLAIGAGAAWSSDSTSEGFLAFGLNAAWLSPPAELWSTPAPWMREAVGGRPRLVDGGLAGSGFADPSHCPARNPRTAAGLSQDRQTLWLVVVDGRSSAAAGMTCDELAVLMRDLGAHTALNLDGGGSSAIWVAGSGVVNEPSDGSERVVANHLAVHADGGSAPGDSCDFWQDEVTWDAGVLDDRPTDVDGDGLPDVCARAAAGLRCHPSTGTGFGTALTTDSFADASGWNDESNYSTLRFGDYTGDGLADVCARGNIQVYCKPSTGAGWGATVGGPLLDDADWKDPKYGSTLRMADLDGDGDDDLCGRSAGGLRCWLVSGGVFGAAVAGPDLSDAAGWDEPQHYGTLRFGDIDGDGDDDVCARAVVGVLCWRSDGTGAFPTRVDGPLWSDAAGWTSVSTWGTIRLADVDGDGMADLCGRSADGFSCALATGSGFAAPGTPASLTDANGWAEHDNASTIRLGDLDADGDLDLCARANAGMRCWPFADGGFGSSLVGPGWSDAEQFDDPRLYTTIRMADLTGDGRADLCARGVDGFSCAASDGAAFPTTIAGPAWSDASGWSAHPYFTTIRLGGVRPRPEEDDTDVVDTDVVDTDVVDTDVVDTDVVDSDVVDTDVVDSDPVDSADTDPSGDLGRRERRDPACGCHGSTSGAEVLWLAGAVAALRRRRRLTSAGARAAEARTRS